MSIEKNEEFRPKIVAFCWRSAATGAVMQAQTWREAAVCLIRLT